MNTTQRQYEFEPQHNRVIGSLARTMVIFGVALMVFGIVQLVFSLDARRADMPAPLVPGVLGLMFGGLLIYSADAFRKIVTTQGRDVDHLMDALSRLRFTFGLQLFIAVLAVIAAIAVMFLNQSAY